MNYMMTRCGERTDISIVHSTTKLGFIGVNTNFLITVQNIDCWYS